MMIAYAFAQNAIQIQNGIDAKRLDGILLR